MLLVAHSKFSQNPIWHESLKMYCVCPHLAWRFSISRSLSRWSLFRASLCLRVCVSKFSSAYSSCSFSCSSRAFARWTRVRFSCRRRACCSSLSDESFSSSHTRFSNSNTCGTDTAFVPHANHSCIHKTSIMSMSCCLLQSDENKNWTELSCFMSE